MVIPADTLTFHDTACAFSRDGTRLFVASEDGRVRVYHVASRKEIPGSAWKAHTTAITAMAMSRAGDVIATAADGSMALWSTEQDAGHSRRERLRIPMDRARNWIHFATGDRALLHSAPERPVELWDAPAAP